MPREGLPYFFCTAEEDGQACLKKVGLVSFCPLLEHLPRVSLPQLMICVYMFGTMSQMVDARHETRLSEKTVSAVYHTLRQMLCDFMVLRNENVHLGGPDLSGSLVWRAETMAMLKRLVLRFLRTEKILAPSWRLAISIGHCRGGK